MTREDYLVIIDWQPHLIRASIGIEEVVAHPTVSIPARVGLRAQATTPTKASEYLVGQELEEAMRSGEDIEAVWPLQQQQARNGSTSEAQDGKQKEGVVDWLGLEALFRHVIFSLLGLSPKPANYSFLLAHPISLPPSSLEFLTRLFFESLCVSSFLLIERPIVQLYSCATITGVVVDVGKRSTEISVVAETQTYHPGCLRVDIGEDDCDGHLKNVLLKMHAGLPQALAGEGNVPLEGEALARSLQSIIDLLKEGEFLRYGATAIAALAKASAASNSESKVDEAPIPTIDQDEEEEEGITDVAKALASGKVAKLLSPGSAGYGGIVLSSEGVDVLLVPHPSGVADLPPIAIGPERHRYAEPLMGLVQAIKGAVERVPTREVRNEVWQNVVFTGGVARIRGLAPQLIAQLSATTLDPSPSQAVAQPDGPAPANTRRARHAKTPDYFSEYRERPDMTSFLGACIYAKFGFLESVGGEFITKQVYNQYGPKIATMLVP